MGERIRKGISGAWQQLAGPEAIQTPQPAPRRTLSLPSILTPYNPGSRPGQALSLKPTAANLRRFAETPVARRAINVVKDKIASMDWQIKVRRGYTESKVPFAQARMRALRAALEEPNAADSFRTLWEQVLEDILVGGFGAVEMKSTGDRAKPFELFAVDGAAIQVDARWQGGSDTPRYGFATGLAGLPGFSGADAVTPLRDDELMYIRLNPRSHTPFGLGRLEVAFETVNQFLSANRYAGRLASNSVVQYALWLDETTPEQHDRLIRWWQDEIEGTGRVPVLSCAKKPEVLRFAGGTDADLRIQWQEFLIRMIANAFELPPMLLGLTSDVNRSTAGELADEAFLSAIVPVAKLVAEHITRDLFSKKLGWREFEFCFNELEQRNETEEVALQVQLLQAGVLSIAEVRAMRGLAPATHPGPSEAQKQEAE
jgi:HK97 family phage portal protein